MTQYLIRRLSLTAIIVLVVAVGVFLLLRVTPGDPVLTIVGTGATPEQIAEIRAALGLDRPVHVQLIQWLIGASRGDLGTSIVQGRSVTELIVQRLPATFELALLALVLAVLVGVSVGSLAALRGGLFDSLARPMTIIGMCVPSFALALILIYLFAVRMSLLPLQGFVPISESPSSNLSRMVLPVVSLAMTPAALLVRMTRAAVLDVLGEDYVRTARAKGLAEMRVVMHHVLRTAALPVVTAIGVILTFLLSGSIVVETVFNIPGVGRLLIEAVLRRDYPVVQGVVLYVALVNVSLNLLVDILYAIIDPRIRYT